MVKDTGVHKCFHFEGNKNISLISPCKCFCERSDDGAISFEIIFNTKKEKKR